MYRIMFVAVGACFLLAACETTTPSPGVTEWETTFTGEGEWAHLAAAALVVATPAQAGFTATAELTGDEAGAVRPWHVHFNSCAQGGGIVGADGDYPRLTVGGDGTATATASVPQALSTGAAYHVNVHLSEAQMDVVIACGDLVLTN